MTRAILLLLAAVTPAAGAETAKPRAAMASGMDLGLDLLQKGDHEPAAAALLHALQALKEGDERQERARFHLGRALRELGYFVVADELLASVVRSRTVPELVPLALALLLQDLDQRRADTGFVEAVLVNLDVGTLAGEQADAVAFHQGMADLREGRLKWAEASFRAIQDPRFSHRASLALAAYYLWAGDAETASQSFSKVADASDAPPEARNLAVLSLARLAAERGLAKDDRAELEGARASYDRVKRPHSVSAEVLLERAWLEYQLGDSRRALGYLLALDAPAHRDQMLPDKYVLRALIYAQACHYSAARKAALQLPADFADVVEALRRRQSPEQSGALRRVLRLEPEVEPLEALLSQVQHEADSARGIADEKLVAWLGRRYQAPLAEAKRQLLAARERALPMMGRQLLDAMADLKVVEFELALKLHRRVRGDTLARSERLGAVPEIPIGGDRAFFPFDGEYWGDEIADLVVYLEDLCVE